MKALSVLIFFFVTLWTNAQQQEYARVKIALGDSTLIRIGQLGIAAEGYIIPSKYMITEISKTEMKRLDEAGIPYEILIKDMITHYREQTPVQKSLKSTTACFPSNTYTIPAHFSHGSMGGYLTLNELNTELDEMHSLYPQLISGKTAISAYTTSEGRPLYYVRVSDNPDVDESEPSVLFLSLTHAREPMGMQQLVFFMWYLLENYTSNPEIKYMLDNCQIYFIPCANPDGYNYNATNDPNGGGMWRKNRRNNGDGTYGVDLNRNYGYMWGYDNTGSSPTGSYDNYRGPSAFSEPETQAVKYFCENNAISLIQDYHTYSNVLLYPWGYINQSNNDSLLYKTYSALMTAENGFNFGTPMQCIGYNANGGSFDWFYGETVTKNKIIAWGPEAGDQAEGFYPPESAIDQNCQEFMGANLYMVRFALNYAKTEDASPRFITSLNGYEKFNITRLGMQNGTFTVSLHCSNPLVNISGNTKTFNNLALLEKTADSIAFTLDPSIAAGSEITFVWELYNGYYSTFDTTRKIYGTPQIVFSNNGNSPNGFTSNTWGVTTSEYFSSPGAMTDSPSSNYSSNTNSSCMLSQPVNLYGATHAEVSYFARWDIEKDFDYVEFQASNNNGATWTALCSKRMNEGSADQDQGKPLYEGQQNDWVLESFDIDAYTGTNVLFRFILISDGAVNKDGFYFDNFKIEALMPSGIDETGQNDFHLYPNPAGDYLYLEHLLPSDENYLVEIIDLSGRKITEQTCLGGNISINISNLIPGTYFLGITRSGQSKSYQCFSKE